MEERFHQSALRKWRASLSGSIYSITKCVDDTASPLIRDPMNPETESEVPKLVVECLRWLHKNGRLRCEGYVVMPDHVHLIVALGEDQDLSNVIASFGSYSARGINRVKHEKGRFWQRGFYDHRLRSKEAFSRHLGYIRENPVRKGYVESPEDWPYSCLFPDW